MIDRIILDKIQAHALDIDWHVAFGGKANGNRHLFRVVIIANFLAEKEGADRDICEAGAWLHDIGLSKGNDDNPSAIRQTAEDYLKKLALDETTQRRIAECAETHEGARQAVSLEARIVHDSDVLDKMGLLGVIRHTWKITNLINKEATAEETYDLVQDHLRMRRERLYTKTASRLVKPLKTAQHQFFADKNKAIKSISMIMREAKQGITSDKIARKLLSQIDDQTLAGQLNISKQSLQWWYDLSA